MHLNKLFLTLFCLFSFISTNVNAANNQGKVIIVPITGFTDNTPASPVGGNYHDTIGEQRLAVFERAAFIWSTILNLDYNITVDASFASLYCSSGSATLGYAGPNRVKKINNVWYATAQANQISKSDTSGTYSDIYADFNSDIDNGCYNGAPNGWYYGLDNNPPSGKEALLDVVLHEIAHGLGFLTFVDADTGAYFNSYPDSYTKQLRDSSNNKLWSNMTNSERISSFRSNTLFWAGSNANTFADSVFPDNAGYIDNSIRMHNPSNYSAGSSVSHISTYATPNQLMEPYNTNDGVEPVVEPYMLKDMGFKLKEDLNNDAPIALDYSVTTSENTPITLYPMNNTTDVNGDTVNFYRFTKLPEHGTIDPFDSSPTYVPDSNYTGVDTIQWETYDVNFKVSNIGTITINVGTTNSAPVVSNDSYTIDEDNTGNFSVLLNDTDDSGIDISTLSIESDVSNGVLSLSNGIVNYTPNNNYNGTDQFSYTVKDNAGLESNIGTVDINISPVNDLPVAAIDTFSVAYNSFSNSLNLLSNDTDIDDTLTYSNVVIATNPANGILSKNSNEILYTPSNNFYGSDGFTYYLNDGKGNSSTVAVSIDVVNNNIAPSANSDSFTMNEDELAIVFVLNNDTDDEDVSLSSIVIDRNPSNGIVNDTNGKIVYTPNTNFSGIDSLSYHLIDSMGEKSNSVDVVFTVNEVNDAPLVNDDSYNLDENTSLIMETLNNDSDIEDSSLLYSNISIITSPENGIVSLLSNGILYTPSENYFGDDSFVYEIFDSNGLSSIGTVYIQIDQVIENPTLTDGAYSLDEDTSVEMNVFDWLTLGDFPIDSYNLVSNVSNGTLSQNGNIITYVPNNNFFGEDTLSFNVVDTEGNVSNDSTILITVNSVNDLPVVNSDQINLPEDSFVNIYVLSNDSDIEDELDISMVSITGNASSGSLIIENDYIKYTPDENFTGADAFEYTVTDSDGSSASNLVFLFVDNVLDSPVVNNSSFNVDEDNSINIDLSTISIEGDFLIDSYTINTESSNGSYTLNGSILSYTPNENFNGFDSISLYATDSEGNLSENAELTFSIDSINDAPVSNDDYISIGTSISSVTLLENDFDIDNSLNSSTIIIDTNPVNGEVSVSGTNVYYKVDNNTVSSDQFDYHIVDSEGASSNTSTVYLTIIDDTPPVATEDIFTVLEDSFENSFEILNNDYSSKEFIEVVIYSQPSNGSLIVDGLNLKYTPNNNFSGNDEFYYYVKDSINLQSNIVSVSVIVEEVNDNPISLNDTFDVYYNSSNIIDLLSNDIDENISNNEVIISKNPTYGSISEANGLFTYTPYPQFESQTDDFEYYIVDSEGLTSNTSSVNINIIYDITPPTTGIDTFTVASGETHELNILSNDNYFTDNVDVILIDNPLNSYTLNSLLIFESVDSGNFTLTYKLVDDLGQESNISSINIEVFDVIEVKANEDNFSVNEDSFNTLDVLSNDTFNEVVSLEILNNVSNGVLEKIGNVFKYTPHSNYSGTDSFTYMITDIYGDSYSTNANITVVSDNSDFNTVSDSYYLDEDGRIEMNVIFNDLLELNSNNIKINIVSEPDHGHANVTGNNTILYDVYANYNGKDSLTYTITDLSTGIESNVSNVSITVLSVNDSPSAIYDIVSVYTEVKTEINFVDNDMDIDSEISGYKIVDYPQNGQLIFEDSKVYYISNVNFEGEDSFTYYVYDNENKESNLSTVDIRVNTGLNYVPSTSRTSETKESSSAGSTSILILLLFLALVFTKRRFKI